MTGIEEAAALIAGTLVTIAIAKISHTVGIKVNKNKLKKLLNRGFEELDYDVIKQAFTGLVDFDSKHGTRKLEKYLLPIVHKFRDDEERMNINHKNLKLSMNDFSKLENIFDEDEEEVEEQNNVVEEQIEVANVKLQEIKKRRDEVIARKNQIRSLQRIKRRGGAMG